LKLEVFTCRICAETGRDDYDFCRNCVPLGRHCNDCVTLGCCSGLAFVETSTSTLADRTSQRFDRNVSRILGFALIIIGMFPLIFGLVGSSTTCLLSGCPPDMISRLYWQSVILFFSGIALVTIGIMSVFLARHMKPANASGAVISQVHEAQ
jgi:uncharacterized membrane protein